MSFTVNTNSAFTPLKPVFPTVTITLQIICFIFLCMYIFFPLFSREHKDPIHASPNKSRAFRGNDDIIKEHTVIISITFMALFEFGTKHPCVPPRSVPSRRRNGGAYGQSCHTAVITQTSNILYFFAGRIN